MYYPCSENNLGADQLCSYCTADPHICFCIGNNLVFSQRGTNDNEHSQFSKTKYIHYIKLLIHGHILNNFHALVDLQEVQRPILFVQFPLKMKLDLK